MMSFSVHSKRGDRKPLEKGASTTVSLGCIPYTPSAFSGNEQAQESKMMRRESGEANAKKAKLLDLLVALGVSDEHIPRTTKKIDDLMTKKSSGKDGQADNNDSSISEFDVNAEYAHLDDFEELFRVQAPKPTI